MAISTTAASDLLERARAGKIRVFFHIANTADDCIVYVEQTSEGLFELTTTWYNTDCVGPSHGGTEQHTLAGDALVARLSELVEEPYEIS